MAQSTTAADHSPSRDASQYERYHLGKLEKANKVIGMEVKNTQDEKLGKVKDLAIDLQNGHIVEVIVGSGGVFGVDEQVLAVPPGQFTCDAPSKTLRLNVDKARFKAGPTFSMSNWKAGVRETDVTQVYQYYGIQPYFTQNSSANGIATPTHAAKFKRTPRQTQSSAILARCNEPPN